MSATRRSRGDIRADVEGRLGANDPTIKAIASVVENPICRAVFRLLGVPVDEVRESTAGMREIVDTAVDALPLAEFGWAMSDHGPLDVYKRAAELLRSDDRAAAEELLVGGWNEAGYLRHLPGRLRVMGAADDDLRELAAERSRLAELAWEDHVEARYHASVPVGLLLVDGIAADAAGGSFFSRSSRKADVTDESTLAGMPEALAVVRQRLTERVEETVASGDLNRHGVMHGRELRYDSEANSTKVMVLLAAVWEWAKPLLDGEADRRREGRHKQWAGSNEVNDLGQRMDRRGFPETRRRLRSVALDQTSYFSRHGRYGTAEELVADPVGYRVVGDYEAVTFLAVTGDSWSAWMRSESGWAFAIGGCEADFSSLWRYWDGADVPESDVAEWSADETPNWSGDCN